MAKYLTTRITETYREVVNIDTGAIRRIPYATPEQIEYLEALRLELAKDKTTYTPLKTKPSKFGAAQQIRKLIAKRELRDRQLKLF